MCIAVDLHIACMIINFRVQYNFKKRLKYNVYPCLQIADFGRLFVKFFNQIKDELQVAFKNLYEQMKALPIIEELEQYYEKV